MKIALLVASIGLAQVQDVQVSAPTRLDWEFVAYGFGPDKAKVPANYDSARQKYQLFVPASIKPKTASPLVVFISPGDGPTGLGGWQNVCAREGILFCSPYKAGNNVPVGQRTRIILDVLDDVRRKFRIDSDQTYISGLSGGGRMACTIGFWLPEYFGGVVPVCGTNPIGGPTYLRHRAQDRLSVAFVTGAQDFNRKENEKYMAPFFKDLGVRSKLWVAPNVGHDTPGPDTFVAVYAWLKEDLKRRRADAKLRPGLAVSADEAPSGEEQAKRFLETAQGELQQTERIWRGVVLLQAARQRWGKTEPGDQARQLLKKLVADEKMLAVIGPQGTEDEQKSVTAQAKAFERFGLLDKAVQAWEILARNYADSDVGRDAEMQISRLRGLLKKEK